MHRKKQAYLFLIILGFMIINLQCTGLDSILGLQRPIAPVEGEPPPPNPQESPLVSPTPKGEDGGVASGVLKIVRNTPMLLIIPLLFLAALLLLIIMILRRPKRQRTVDSPDTAPLKKDKQETSELKQVPHLTLVTDMDPALSFPLEQDSLTIGRAEDNDLVIDQHIPGYETVSRNHARLYRRADRWIIEDLGSQNGVYVNEQRTGHNVLQEGWSVRIGGVTFRLHTRSGEVTA